MTAVLDDLDSRPGSTTSILRTFVGLYLRRLGGRIAIADLVGLMEDLGIPPTRTRTGVVRLKQKAVLLADRGGSIGYRLNPDAVPMLERGDRRIFTVRQMTADDRWCLVSFSIPENLRDVRHQLRRRLHGIGCGVVSPALWICPDYLTDEVEGILAELDIRSFVTLFRADEPKVAGTLQEAVRQWWDLDALRSEHLRFRAAIAPLTDPGMPDVDDFAAYVRLVDAWRVLPYLDPGLPASLLPADWPGQRSFDDFRALSGRFADGAWAHVESRSRHRELLRP